jgi:hypothetical protein
MAKVMTILVLFWYFLLTIQNTANRKVRNLFYLLAVFISFSGRALLLLGARCCARNRISWP